MHAGGLAQQPWVLARPAACSRPLCGLNPLPPQVLDTTSTIHPDWHELQEVALFLTQPGVLPPDMGLAL